MYNLQSETGTIESTLMVNNSPQTKKLGIGYTILGWISFAISLLFIPILFGAGAFLMGLLTFWDRNQFHGAVLMGFAFVGTILGSLLSLMVSGTFLF